MNLEWLIDFLERTSPISYKRIIFFDPHLITHDSNTCVCLGLVNKLGMLAFFDDNVQPQNT